MCFCRLTAERCGCISSRLAKRRAVKSGERGFRSMAASKMSVARPWPGVVLPAARRPLLTGGVLVLILMALAIAALAAFGGLGRSSSPTASVPAPSILTGPVRPTRFVQARSAVLALYRSHPGVSRASFNDVDYTTATRDKVLGVCHSGGPEKSVSALESARVLACAPLIFFFYSYGRHASVPEAVDVARKLYWYAVTANRKPVDAGPGLTRLLGSWGVS